MRIVIDMQGCQTESRFRGIGRYSLALVLELVRRRSGHDIVLAVNGLFPESVSSIRAAFHGLLPSRNIRVWHVPGPVRECLEGNDARREAAELMREAFLVSLRPDVILVTSLFEGYGDEAVTSIGRFDTQTPVCVILYDLIPMLNPEQYLRPAPVYARFYERKIQQLRLATRCLAISDSSRQEGMRHLGLSAQTVVNVSTGRDRCFRVVDSDGEGVDGLREKFGLTAPFVLYAGGSDQRKNLPRLVEAFAAMPDAMRGSHQLVMAGKMPAEDVADLKCLAQREGLTEDRLRFTGYVDDEELVLLYRLCHVFVFPSWHEGFGLPALEAMACGAAVIGSDASSLPEVIGRADALFDPMDVFSLRDMLVRALGDEPWRLSLQRHGLRQAAGFSWKETADRALRTMESLPSAQAASPGEAIVLRLVREVAGSCGRAAYADHDYCALALCMGYNHPAEGRRRKLFVDVSELIRKDARTGIQRVTRAVLQELQGGSPRGRDVVPVFSPPGSGKYFQAAGEGGVPSAPTAGEDLRPLDPQCGDVFLGLDLQPQIVPECRHYYQFLRQLGVRVYFVVYDLLPVLLPDAFPPGASECHSRWLEVVAEADGAVCISRSVAEELRTWLRSREIESSRFALHWFHLGADIVSSRPSTGLAEDSADLLRHLAERPFFLMVGTVEPRKGHDQVLSAMQILWKENPSAGLIIVGKRGWCMDAFVDRLVHHEEYGRGLFWLENASDELLEKVYAGAAALILASRGEGFGLPLIEAAHHGLPIIARDLPVFREVAGRFATYFTGKQPVDLADSLRAWLGSWSAQQVPSSAGMPYLTWAQSVGQLLDRIDEDDDQEFLLTEKQGNEETLAHV